MQIPTFPETNHPIIQALSRQNDQELLTLFQQHPEQGQYFTALFCRYSPIVYTLAFHTGRSPVQVDYLFALVWRHVFHEIGGIDLRAFAEVGGTTFQSWLLAVTAAAINEMDVPPVEEIHYQMRSASPPFWCYLDRALDQPPAIVRLMVLMRQTFHWSETRIAAYFQAEGEAMDVPAVKAYLEMGYQALQDFLPEDIQKIYLQDCDAGQPV